MKILLTGSAGYIGARLAVRLKNAGHTVYGVDRRDDAGATDRFTHGDLMDEGVLRRALADVDYVAHLAAAKGDWGISDEEYFRDNLTATRRLLAAGRDRGIDRWLFYSSVSAMGPSAQARDETAPLEPVNAYGASKAAAERLFATYAREEPAARVLVVRPSVVYGPEHPDLTNVYRLIEAIRQNRFVMIGDGTPVKTTSYIDNLLAATLFLMEQQGPGLQTFIYVDEPVLSTGTLVSRIYALLQKQGPRWRLPLRVARPLAYVADVAAALTGIDLPITASRIEKFCTSTRFDASAIRRAGFEQPVGNAEALQETVAWHQRCR